MVAKYFILHLQKKRSQFVHFCRSYEKNKKSIGTFFIVVSTFPSVYLAVRDIYIYIYIIAY